MNNLNVKSEENYNMFDWWKKAIIHNYTNFSGRARRKEYWYTALANIIILLPIYLLMLFSVFQMEKTGEPSILFWVCYGLIILYGLAVFIPGLALIARRLHDTGRSGWYYLLAFIPFVGFIIILVFFVEDSKPGENKWGPNPKGVGNSNQLNQIGMKED